MCIRDSVFACGKEAGADVARMKIPLIVVDGQLKHTKVQQEKKFFKFAQILPNMFS